METFSHETLDPIWVTGFADAVASFTYSRSGKQLALYFAIKLAAAELTLLEEFRSFFGVGKIYELKPAGRYFRVTHREDLVRVVAHFDEFPLRSSKRQVFELWREMVQLKTRFRQPNRDALDSLAAQLSNLTGRTPS